MNRRKPSRKARLKAVITRLRAGMLSLISRELTRAQKHDVNQMLKRLDELEQIEFRHGIKRIDDLATAHQPEIAL